MLLLRDGTSVGLQLCWKIRIDDMSGGECPIAEIEPERMGIGTVIGHAHCHSPSISASGSRVGDSNGQGRFALSLPLTDIEAMWPTILEKLGRSGSRARGDSQVTEDDSELESRWAETARSGRGSCDGTTCSRWMVCSVRIDVGVGVVPRSSSAMSDLNDGWMDEALIVPAVEVVLGCVNARSNPCSIYSSTSVNSSSSSICSAISGVQ